MIVFYSHLMHINLNQTLYLVPISPLHGCLMPGPRVRKVNSNGLLPVEISNKKCTVAMEVSATRVNFIRTYCRGYSTLYFLSSLNNGYAKNIVTISLNVHQ